MEAARTFEKVYLAGPIAGLTYGQSTIWRTNVAKVLTELGYDVYSPMRERLDLAILFDQEAIPHTHPSFRDPFERDIHDIDRCDYVLANLWRPEGVGPSVGTLVELGYAKALGKYIIVVAPDGENEHPFIKGVANSLVCTIDEALDLFEEYRPLSS